MYKKLFAFFGFLLMSFASVSHGSIIDHGTYTTDTASGLEWLDVTATEGMTVGYVSGQLGFGGQFQSWRYATENELNQLFQNAGGNPALQGDYIAHEGIVDLMIGLLGDTFCDPRLKLGISCFTFGGIKFTYGFLSDVDIQGNNYIGSFSDYDNCPAAPAACAGAIFMTHSFIRAPDAGFGWVGSFLVRSTEPTAVPEPLTLPLIIIGLMGLAIMRWKTAHSKGSVNQAV